MLDDLTDAISSDAISDWNIFLGQARDAWGAFKPEATTPFPKKIIVNKGNYPLYTVTPNTQNSVYLPDSSISFISALEQFALPVIAIEPSDAKRLAQSFKAAYGEGVVLASELEVIPLVRGERWQGRAEAFIANSELDWLIPIVLALVLKQAHL